MAGFVICASGPVCLLFCLQEHFFAVPEPGRLVAKINWRINKPNGDFIERSTIQVSILQVFEGGS